MYVIFLITGATFLGIQFFIAGISRGFIVSALLVLSAVALAFIADRFGRKSYYCPNCRRQVDLKEAQCECGAPILAERSVSLDSIPLISEGVIAKASLGTNLALLIGLLMMGAGVWHLWL